MCSGVALFITMLRIRFFTILWPKVPLLLPAPKRECGFFGPGIMKNRLRNMGIKRATPEHMFAIHAYGSGGNLHLLWLANATYCLCCVTLILLKTFKQIIISMFRETSNNNTWNVLARFLKHYSKSSGSSVLIDSRNLTRNISEIFHVTILDY